MGIMLLIGGESTKGEYASRKGNGEEGTKNLGGVIRKYLASTGGKKDEVGDPSTSRGVY